MSNIFQYIKSAVRRIFFSFGSTSLQPSCVYMKIFKCTKLPSKSPVSQVTPCRLLRMLSLKFIAVSQRFYWLRVSWPSGSTPGYCLHWEDIDFFTFINDPCTHGSMFMYTFMYKPTTYFIPGKRCFRSKTTQLCSSQYTDPFELLFCKFWMPFLKVLETRQSENSLQDTCISWQYGYKFLFWKRCSLWPILSFEIQNFLGLRDEWASEWTIGNCALWKDIQFAYFL